MATDWAWKLRLFASADLVGSTAYKQSKSDSEQQWAGTFKEFFRDFPGVVEAAYDRVPEKCRSCPQKLSPWKFSGDEVLFTAQLTNHAEAATHVAAFRHAVSTFPEEWAKKQVPLKLKATSWIAGFPVNNTELVINQGSSRTLDFIGPSIDLGFRIARFADTRRFILSADLALLVIDGIHSSECHPDAFKIYLHGRESLKGVIGNEPYPIVWLDVHDDRTELEEELLGIVRVSRLDKLKQYLLDFIQKTPGMMRPFISGDNDARYSEIPKRQQGIRERLMAEESNRGYLATPENEPEDEGGEDTIFKEPQQPPS